MPLDTAAVLQEIDDVFARCGASKERPSVRMERSAGGGIPTVAGSRGQIAASCLACIERNAPQRSYIEQARTFAKDVNLRQGTLNGLLGILASVRADIEAGYVTTIASRARDEVFADLLEVAEDIANKSAAPAVVLAVSVLEEHVRKLCDLNGIAVVRGAGKHRSFEDMTSDLQREEIILSGEKRTAASWYAQRTEAAHGHFDKVVDDDAPRTIGGVRDFILRHPA